jgi:intracellular septation protein
MKLISELCILVIFFLVYFFTDMYMAIAVAMGLYTVQLGVMLYLRKPITNMDRFSYFTVVVLGGLSLLFQNELFFKWKPSIVYLLMAAGIVITRITIPPLGTVGLSLVRFLFKHCRVEFDRGIFLQHGCLGLL